MLRTNSLKSLCLYTLVSLAALSLADGTASAAILSNNIDNDTGFTEIISSDTWVASRFRTDTLSTTLSTATLLLANDGGGAMSLYLYSDDAGTPATQLGLLTSPASYSSVLSNTEFGGSGLLLSANSIYWLVASAAGGDFEWAYTYDLTGSGPGFLPAWAFTDDAGTTWFAAEDSPMQMRIETQSAVPEPASIILMLTGLMFFWAFRKKPNRRTLLSKQAFLYLVRTGVALGLAFFGGISSATAASFNDLVIFGDSLSDNGNAAYIFENFPDIIPADLPAPKPPLYTSGRYTNGPDVTPGTAHQGTWVEQLAAMLGLADPTPGLPNFLNPALPAGNNLAVAGADTNDGSPVSIANMVSTYLSTQPGGVSDTSLYVLFGGANDLFRATDPVAAAQSAVASIFADVQALHDAGAGTFLVPNLPDLGTTPRAVQSGKVAELHDASVAYKDAWTAALADA